MAGNIGSPASTAAASAATAATAASAAASAALANGRDTKGEKGEKCDGRKGEAPILVLRDTGKEDDHEKGHWPDEQHDKPEDKAQATRHDSGGAILWSIGL